MSVDPARPGPGARGGEITLWLRRWGRGENSALERLLPLVYERLRALARRQMRGERGGHTLQPTALVHEVFLKLDGTNRVPWEGRAHFFAVAAQAMRRVLVDHARKRLAEKRGGAVPHLGIEGLEQLAGAAAPIDTLALDQILSRLEALDERQARIVEQRCFAGMTVPEIAAALAISEATVQRDWRAAKAWLRRELQRQPAV